MAGMSRFSHPYFPHPGAASRARRRSKGSADGRGAPKLRVEVRRSARIVVNFILVDDLRGFLK